VPRLHLATLGARHDRFLGANIFRSKHTQVDGFFAPPLV
jgi:hypothetical protein